MRKRHLIEVHTVNLGEILNRKHDEEKLSAPIPIDVHVQRLRDHLADFNVRHIFKPGEIIKSKAGLSQYTQLENAIAIVMEVLHNPIVGQDTNQPCEFGARLDLRIGLLIKGRFSISLVESAFFEPLAEPAA